MRLAIDRSRQWIVTFSLTGVSFIAGCGGGAETPAPVANNPAPAAAPMPNNPQAMMTGQHGQPGAPAGMPMPGAANPPAPVMNDPAAAMQASMAHNGGTANPAAAPAGGAANPQLAAHAAFRANMANPAAAGAGTNPAAAHAGGTAALNANLNPAAAAAPNPAAAHAGGTAALAGNAPGNLPEAHAAANAAGAPVAQIPPNAPAALAGANAAEAMAANQAAGAGTLAAGGELAGPGGNAQGGPGGANAITGEPGSIEYAITKLISMAKAGDYAGVESIISEKAKGLAANFRDQDLKPTQIESYKTTFDGMQGLNRRAAGGNGVQYTFKKGETTIQITLIKETGGMFKIKELQIRDGKVR
ncbi:MAG: hypothetical protein Q8K78_14200 [Planctomycetaceae bacterium]|nr:hypothetical protein [Planctomycetaceae bacterium]